MSSVLDAPPPSNGAASYAAVIGTVATHGLLVVVASLVGVHGVSSIKKLLPATEMVEVELPEAPKQPPDAPEPATLTPRTKAVAPSPAPPPPTAAQAGEVLDAKSDVVDFSDTIVTGTGDKYAGGVTDSTGSSTNAVHDPSARGDASGRAVKPAPPVVVVDLSRPPQLAGSAQWQCPFPFEADDAGVDHAAVGLRVEVAADGSVRSVSTSADPGNGFGREAKRCATSKRWTAALDRLGHPVAGVATVNVRFDR